MRVTRNEAEHMSLPSVNHLGSICSIVGCIVAVGIAILENIQLKKLHKISKDTGSTVSKVNADAHRQRVVGQFFGFDQGKKLYKCMIPAVRTNKPVASIHSGDYYALHVLQMLLGNEHLELSFQYPEGDRKHDGKFGDAIFLCSPNANPALNELAPPLELSNPKSAPAPTFDGVAIPCWFSGEETGELIRGENYKIKKIWTNERAMPLASEAESLHRQCLEQGQCEPARGSLTDLAILLRLTVQGRKVFVVAGIHQFGTWITGEFIRRLAVEHDVKTNNSISLEDRRVLCAEDDIAAVVYGEFNPKTLTFGNLGIYERLLWRKSGEEWHRVGSKKSHWSQRFRRSRKGPSWTYVQDLHMTARRNLGSSLCHLSRIQ